MRGLFCSAAIAGVAGLAHAQELAVEPGLWQAESRVEAYRIIGGERTALPDVMTSHSRCITADRPLLSVSDLAGIGCDVTDVSTRDDTLSFVLTCRRDGAGFYGSMSAERLKSGRQVETHMHLAGRQPDGSEIQITAESTVSRTGDCR